MTSIWTKACGVFIVSSAFALGACGGGGGGSGKAETGNADLTSPDQGAPTNPETPATPGEPTTPSQGALALSGNPTVAIVAGQAYLFQPKVTAPAGAKLEFSATNLPAWLKLDASSGRLTGTPATADIGAHKGIAISVTDGTSTASLPAFGVEVQAVGEAALTLSWDLPEETTSVEGYRIHYGTEPGNYSTTLTIANATLTSAMIEGLTPGTYYISMTSFDDQGNESEYAQEVMAAT